MKFNYYIKPFLFTKYKGTPGGSTPINIHNVDIVGGPPQAAEFEEIGVAGGIGAMSTLRIGPGGLKKTPAGSAARRKQKIQYRDGESHFCFNS